MIVKYKMEASSTSGWERILKAGKHDDANCDCQGVGEQRLEPGTAPEDEDYSNTTVDQEVISDDIKKQVAKLLTAIPELI